jgi:hypothetical protein
MDSRTRAALEGVVSGGTVGMGVAGPWGALAGGVVGGVAGAATGGETDAEKLQRERFEDLKRRQELGQLGYSEQEMSVIMAKEFGAMAQQQRAQREQQAALMASQSLGAGSIRKEEQERQAILRDESQELRDKAERLRLEKEVREEAELDQRTALQLQKEQQDRDAMLQSLAQGAALAGRAKELSFLQKQAEDVRDQEAKKRAASADAAIKAAQQSRLAAYGNQTVGSIESSPTMIGAQPAGSVVAAQPLAPLAGMSPYASDPLMAALMQRQRMGGQVYDLEAAQGAGLLQQLYGLGVR